MKASDQALGVVDTEYYRIVLFWYSLSIQLFPSSLVFSQTGLFNCEL